MGVSDVLLDVIDARVRRGARPDGGFAAVTTAAPLTVTFPGDTAAVPLSRLASYTPTIGDTAVLLRVGTRWVAIGSLAT